MLADPITTDGRKLSAPMYISTRGRATATTHGSSTVLTPPWDY
jgi:hypothetical protein